MNRIFFSFLNLLPCYNVSVKLHCKTLHTHTRALLNQLGRFGKMSRTGVEERHAFFMIRF